MTEDLNAGSAQFGSGTAHLLFAPEYVQPIVDEEKTATVRYNDADGIGVGDTIELRTEQDGIIRRAEVRRTATLLACEALSFIEIVGAKYPTETPLELIKGVSRHYNDGIRPGTTVRVICWELIEP